MLPIIAGAYTGAITGGLVAKPFSWFYKETVDDLPALEARPVSKWTHVPALEHAVGMPVGAVVTKAVLNNMRAPMPRAGTTIAFALFALVYMNTTAVKDRVVECRKDGRRATSYLVTRDFLLGRWDAKYHRADIRTGHEFPCINL